MKKVFIVSYYFPPYNTIAARRYGGMVKYMEECGWQPYILTSISEGVLPVEIDEKFIYRIGNCNGVHASQDEYVYKNKKILFWSTLIKVLKKLNIKLRTFGRTVLEWYPIVKQDMENMEEDLKKCDVIIASYGPPSALWIGRYLSKKYNRPWVADIRDLSALRPDGRNKISLWIDKKIEKIMFSNVSGIVTVSNTLEKILEGTYKKKTKAIYNGWDRRPGKDFDNIHTHMQNKIGGLRYIYYAGMLYEHQMRSIEMLIEVLSEVNDEDLSLVIRSLALKEMEDRVIEMAIRNGVKDRVLILEPCNPETVEREQKNAIINLVIENLDMAEEWARGTLTGKFLELIIKEAPVLAIARRDSEIGDILNDTTKGKLCSTKNEIKQFLGDINSNVNKYVGEHENINKYSKKSQAKELCDFLESVI